MSSRKRPPDTSASPAKRSSRTPCRNPKYDEFVTGQKRHEDKSPSKILKSERNQNHGIRGRGRPKKSAAVVVSDSEAEQYEDTIAIYENEGKLKADYEDVDSPGRVGTRFHTIPR